MMKIRLLECSGDIGAGSCEERDEEGSRGIYTHTVILVAPSVFGGGKLRTSVEGCSESGEDYHGICGYTLNFFFYSVKG